MDESRTGPVEALLASCISGSPTQTLGAPRLAWEEYQRRAEGLGDISEQYHEASKLAPYMMPTFSEGTRLFFTPKFVKLAASTGPRFIAFPRVELPRDISPITTSFHDLSLRRASTRRMQGSLTLAELSSMAYYSVGISRANWIEDPAVEGGFYPYPTRMYASGGGLYPVDTYLFVTNVDGLAPGAYYYDPRDHALRGIYLKPDFQKRYEEDFVWGWEEAKTSGQAAHFVFTASFWRSKAKYGHRGYRFTLQESGHAAENVYYAAAAMGLAATGIGGYYDDRVADMLGLDGVDEAVVHSVAIGRPHPEFRLSPAIPPGAYKKVAKELI